MITVLSKSVAMGFSVMLGGFAAVPVAPLLEGPPPAVDCYCTATTEVTDSGNLTDLTDPTNEPTKGGCRNEGEPLKCTNKTRQCQWIPLGVTYSAPSGGVYYQTGIGGGNTSGAVSCRSGTEGEVHPGLGVSCECDDEATVTTFIYTTSGNCSGDGPPPTGAGALGWVKFAMTCADCDK